MPLTPQSFRVHTPTDDADGIYTAATPGAAGSLTLDGAQVSNGVATPDTADIGQIVRITSAGDDSGIHFILTGKDADGGTQVQNVAGSNAGNADTTLFWSEVSDITISAAAAGNVTIGWLNSLDFVSKTLRPDWRNQDVVGIQADTDGAQIVTITSAGDDTAVTFTPNGTRRGKAVSDSITGANATIASGTVLFDEVTSIGTTGDAGTVTAGGNSDADGIATSHDPASGADLTFGNSAFTTTSNGLAVMPNTLTYSVDYTLDPIGNGEQPNWSVLSGMSGKTTLAVSNAIVPVQGIRLRVTAYTTGSAILTLVQKSR